MDDLRNREIESLHGLMLIMQSFERILKVYLNKLEQVAVTCMLNEDDDDVWSVVSDKCTDGMTEQVVVGRILSNLVANQTELMKSILYNLIHE